MTVISANRSLAVNSEHPIEGFTDDIKTAITVAKWLPWIVIGGAVLYAVWMLTRSKE